MKKSLLTLCVLVFILPLSAQVGPSVTYEKFVQAAPPITQVGVLKADATLRAQQPHQDIQSSCMGQSGVLAGAQCCNIDFIQYRMAS